MVSSITFLFFKILSVFLNFFPIVFLFFVLIFVQLWDRFRILETKNKLELIALVLDHSQNCHIEIFLDFGSNFISFHVEIGQKVRSGE